MSIKRTLASVAIASALCGQAWAGPFEDGAAAYDRADYAAAMQLWRPLAEQGNLDAQINLGNMFYDGNGVRLDYDEAVKWYRLAADHGSADAQNALGFLYKSGDAVPQDYVQAHMWFDIAGANSYRDDVAALMTPAQIAEAQKFAREWKPK